MSGKILTVKREPPTPLSAASTEVTLVHFRDAGKAGNGIIPESEVRQLTVNAVADTDVIHLVIDEETRGKLGLRVEETVEVALTGGERLPAG
jgi:hypothetical protein